MPTVMTIASVRVMIYLNDHRPAHVHLLGPNHKAVIDLLCPNGPPAIRENYGFSGSEPRRFSKVLSRRVATLWLAKYPAAVAVHYDGGLAQLVIALSNSKRILVAPQTIRGLEQARPEDLVDVQISPYGQGIHFPAIDADIYIPALLDSLAAVSTASR